MAPLVREKNVKRTIRRGKSDGRCQELAMSQNYELCNSRNRKPYYVPPVYNEKKRRSKKNYVGSVTCGKNDPRVIPRVKHGEDKIFFPLLSRGRVDWP